MKHEINSQNTKRMLADMLISLLHTKPISKITVSEIVNLCDINRKTFYYHFQDVYDLLEWHLDCEVEKIIDTLNPLDDFTSTVTYAMEYMNQYAYLRNCIDNPPSLTVGKNKNGHKASKIKLCSRFLFRNDMCYILVLEKFIILVSLIMLRIVDFLINS